MNIAPKVSKDLISKLGRLHSENQEQFEAAIANLAVLYYPIRVGHEEDKQKAIESLRALVLEKAAKAADAVREQRALDFSNALNELGDIELFIKDGKKYISVGTVFMWLKGRLDAAFEENMTPTITRKQEEDGSFSYQFSVVAQKRRGRAPSSHGGRFRPDITTLLDGTPVIGHATNVLRSEQFKNTKAGLDWAMVEKGIAKGARSAIFLGLANDAQKVNGHDVPIFRVWALKRDENDNVVYEDGKPVAIELDANGSQYIENLTDNKAKFANVALQDIRAKVPQPIWTPELLNLISKKEKGNPTPAPVQTPAIAVPTQPAISLAPVAPVPISAPIPVTPMPVAARRRATGGPIPIGPGGPVPVR